MKKCSTSPEEIVSKKAFFETRGYSYELVEKILRLDRQYKAIMNSMEDTHHLVARSRGGSDRKQNRKKMRRGDHQDHHDYHGVRLPHEQLEASVQFNRRAFQRQFVQRIEEIIDESHDSRKIYIPEVFK